MDVQRTTLMVLVDSISGCAAGRWNVEPSEPDLALTRILKHALALVDVRLVDQITISGQGTTLLSRKQLWISALEEG